MGLFTKTIDCQMKSFVQLLQVPARQVAPLDILEVMPASFVPGIQVWRVAWQRFHMHFASRVRQLLRDFCPPVDGRTVPDDQQSFLRYSLQVHEKLDGVQSVQRFLPHQGVDLARRRHSAHHRQVVAGLLFAKDGSVGLRGVGPDHPRQQVEARFILENQRSPLASRSSKHFRPYLVAPTLNGLFVALDGTSDGYCGRPLQFLQQPFHVVLLVVNAELLLDNASNAGTSSHLTAKTVRFRAVPQKLGKHTQVAWRKSSGEARPRPYLERPHYSFTVNAGKPTAHRLLADSQGNGNIALVPALLLEKHCAKSPPLSTVTKYSVARFHSQLYASRT